MPEAARRLHELRELEAALRDLLTILASIPREPWTWHFEPLLEATVAMQKRVFTQDDLRELSNAITALFEPRDAGFDGWKAEAGSRQLDDTAARVLEAARALRFV